MLYQLRNLKDSEKQEFFKGPYMVALLIGGADGELSNKEIDRVSEVIHVKTYSEKNDLEDFYKILDAQEAADEMNSILNAMPVAWEERHAELTNRLSALGAALKKLDKAYAVQYYNSLKDIAVQIANASGGVFGVGQINESEHEMLTLSMIEKP